MIDAKDIDLTNRKHIYALINDIESEQNVRRKKNAYIAFECQEGRQKDHVKDRLNILYPETSKKFRVGNVEAVKKIVNKKSKAYKTSPIRKLDDDAQTIALEELYDKFKFSRAFKEADRIFNLHKYTCLWLSYTNPPEDGEELEGTYNLQALAPYEYDLVRDDKGVPFVFIQSYSGIEVTKGEDGIEQTITEDQRDTSAESKRYSFWTARHFVSVVTKGKAAAGNPFIESMKVINNPISRLPIAFLSQDTSADYPIPSAMADKSIDWNVEFSDLKTASATQGHGQLTISAPETMKLRVMHMGMHTAINLPQSRKATDKPTTAEYISASPDLAGQLGVLKFSLLQMLDDEGITTSSAIEGGVNQVTSGFDRLLKEADVQDIIEDNQELYSDCLEPETYLTLKAYEDALNSTAFRSENIDTSFLKPKVLITDKETLDNIEKREGLGLSLSYEKHMIIDPNLSKESAIKREEEILSEQDKKAGKMRSILGVGDTTNQGDTKTALLTKPSK